MSETRSLITFLEDQNQFENNIDDNIQECKTSEAQNATFFDIEKFSNELKDQSIIKNKKRLSRKSQNITGYDICNTCIQQILFKLRNTPLEAYADPWLPIVMRTEIGNAAHLFLQNHTTQFTEIEANLKVPSIKFYGKADFLIGSDVLGEIKTCTYSDYKQILKNNKPREKDYLQAMTYVYMLENYLDEIKSDSTHIHQDAGVKPKLDKYNIDYIQFVYIAHDIVSADIESMIEMNKIVKEVKSQLNSKRNPFFFITSLVLKLSEEDKEKIFSFIKRKIEAIHQYYDSNKNPLINDEFVDHSNCFFCPYNTLCDIKKT